MTTIKLSLLFLFAISLSDRLPAEDLPFGRVERAVQERTRETVRWEKDQAVRKQTLEQVRWLLRRPLTMNSAIQIALLNNQSLQATFEEIGLSAADLQEAGTIPNPRLDLSARFPDKPPSGTDIEFTGVIDFLNILMIPLKRRVAEGTARGRCASCGRRNAQTLRGSENRFLSVTGLKRASDPIRASWSNQ